MDQNDPIEPGEFILRRVPYSKNNLLVDIDSAVPVTAGCFSPTSDDTEGISVFREKFVSGKEVADRYREDKQKECYIIRINVDDLEGIVTIEQSPSDYLEGHAHIPELNVLDKNQCRAIRPKITKKLTIDNVIHWPKD
ncbi:MAG: hypothetical protein GY875_00575 [Gammaproteobacteria bacterium]|nr:hypothetical protein [Gammaproteobacteria bacterium]